MPSSICALIPTYNRAPMIKECIDSILAQTRPVQQIIVINDGSTDNTQDVVKAYGEKVTLINKPNGGKSIALNVGLQHATADYIWICDDDDIAAPDGLEHLAKVLDEDTSVDFVCGTNTLFVDTPTGRVFSNATYHPRQVEPSIKLRFLEGMFTHQFAMLVRRSLYEKVGPFREDLIRSQDLEMSVRLSRYNKAIYVPHVVFYQRQHEGMRGSSSDQFDANKNKEKWLTYNQKIFVRVKQDYSLQEFTPTFALQRNAQQAKRAALIERSYIFAMHGMWQDSADDIVAACGISGVPTEEELYLSGLLLTNDVTLNLFSPNAHYAKTLRDGVRINDGKDNLISVTFSTLTWRARKAYREGGIKKAIHRIRIMFAVLGFKRASQQVIRALTH